MERGLQSNEEVGERGREALVEEKETLLREVLRDHHIESHFIWKLFERSEGLKQESGGKGDD